MTSARCAGRVLVVPAADAVSVPSVLWRYRADLDVVRDRGAAPVLLVRPDGYLRDLFGETGGGRPTPGTPRAAITRP